MEQERSPEDPAERAVFETMRATYAVVLEPEQHAMIKELRRHLKTIPSGERQSLIDAIESSIAKTFEDEREFEL